jgi:hypothetical protein
LKESQMKDDPKQAEKHVNIKHPVVVLGKRPWIKHTDNCSRSREGIYSKGCTCDALM